MFLFFHFRQTHLGMHPIDNGTMIIRGFTAKKCFWWLHSLLWTMPVPVGLQYGSFLKCYPKSSKSWMTSWHHGWPFLYLMQYRNVLKQPWWRLEIPNDLRSPRTKVPPFRGSEVSVHSAEAGDLATNGWRAGNIGKLYETIWLMVWNSFYFP